MTDRQEQQLFNTLRSLRKEVGELREMLRPHAPKEDVFLNFDQAMRVMGVSRSKLFGMLRDGELPFAVKMGGRWRFSKNALIAYIGKTS